LDELQEDDDLDDLGELQDDDDLEELHDQATEDQARAVFAAAAHRRQTANDAPANGSIAFLLSQPEPEPEPTPQYSQTLRVQQGADEQQVFGDNTTVPREELMALLRNKLLPSDCYGPAPREAVQAVSLPDGSISLIVALGQSWRLLS